MSLELSFPVGHIVNLSEYVARDQTAKSCQSRRTHPKRLINCSGQLPHNNGRLPSLPLTGVNMLSFFLSLTTSEM